MMTARSNKQSKDDFCCFFQRRGEVEEQFAEASEGEVGR